jgi:hypothetical protein
MIFYIAHELLVFLFNTSVWRKITQYCQCSYNRKSQYRRNYVSAGNFLSKLVWVRHEWRPIPRLNFPNLFFWIYICLCLVEYLLLQIFVFYWFWTYCKILYKTKKTFQAMTLFRTPTRFFHFLTKKNIFVPRSPKGPRF